ncbi:MAG: rubredoxin-like domain-containing protein [Lachnospiraceae bacterium]
MKKLKCLVCGEIFDADVEVCPVCGVGKENFVEIEVEETAFRRDSQDTYLTWETELRESRQRLQSGSGMPRGRS